MWLLDREMRESGYKFFWGTVDLYEPKLECLWLESYVGPDPFRTIRESYAPAVSV